MEVEKFYERKKEKMKNALWFASGLILALVGIYLLYNRQPVVGVVTSLAAASLVLNTILVKEDRYVNSNRAIGALILFAAVGLFSLDWFVPVPADKVFFAKTFGGLFALIWGGLMTYQYICLRYASRQHPPAK